MHRVRVAYLHAVLRQEVAWFDANKPAELAAQMAADTAMMQHDGMGEKVGYLVHFACTFLTGLAIGIAKAPQLTLAMLCRRPISPSPAATSPSSWASSASARRRLYVAAGAVVEQATRGVRTVCSLGSRRSRRRGTARAAAGRADRRAAGALLWARPRVDDDVDLHRVRDDAFILARGSSPPTATTPRRALAPPAARTRRRAVWAAATSSPSSS